MLSFEHGLAFTLNIRTQADVTLDLLIQGMTREGTFTFKHTTASTSIVTSADFRIPDIPIYLTVTQAINSGFQGEIFCAVNLQAGSNIIQQLISGTVYGDKALTWPSNPAADSRPNGGALALRLSANPAAGAELSLDVPIGEVWRVQSVAFQLVTSATVANRKPHIQFLSNGMIAAACYNDFIQTATQTINYAATTYAQPAQTAADGTDFPIAIPHGLLLHSGDTIQTVTTALQAGDNYSFMQVNVEMWFETSV